MSLGTSRPISYDNQNPDTEKISTWVLTNSRIQTLRDCQGRQTTLNQDIRVFPENILPEQTQVSLACLTTKNRKDATYIVLSIQGAKLWRGMITQLIDVSGRQHDQVAVSLEHAKRSILVLNNKSVIVSISKEKGQVNIPSHKHRQWASNQPHRRAIHSPNQGDSGYTWRRECP